MPRSTKTGRKSTAKNYTRFLTARLARRISVAISAFMQLPAFFASCGTETPAAVARLRIDRQSSGGSALDVFVFEAETPFLLDSYQQFHAGEEPVYAVSGLGKKRVVAVTSTSGDLYARASVTRYQDLAKESFSLLDDSPAAPFCHGETIVGEGNTGSVNLTLKPLLSSIRLRSVSCNFSGRSYEGDGFHNDNLLLINVVSESCPLGAEGGRPVSWLNYGFQTSGHPYLKADGLGDIGPGRTYCNVLLYCYPNPEGSPPTRLVLEGTVGDIRCYYPINLPVVKSGTRLALDVTIRRMGTSDPDSEALPGTFTVEFTSEPWYERETAIETF